MLVTTAFYKVSKALFTGKSMSFHVKCMKKGESPMDKSLYENALEYHRSPTPGKLCITATKPLNTQQDLALAYSPGVAAACLEIEKDPSQAANYTARANLVGVITNGTAVLGLGNIGPLAGKPVMEGKAVLFKKFAGIDVFDIEINETDPDKLVEIIASLEPTFGGINLEDIKAPECFDIERRLSERLKIPVFHDDQHGTAIIVGAAVLNGLELVDKKISQAKVVCSGAGAAALACLTLLEGLGLKRENITVCDQEGVIFKGRTTRMDPFKESFAKDTKERTLMDAIQGADIFLGLSAGNVLSAEMVSKMAHKPLILALANPTPEIDPNLAKQTRPDAIVATGRSDFPNQVNNVLCFPYIFRGALDVGASTINDAMKIACVKAIADLAKAEASDVVANAYHDEEMRFGPEYLIPKPFDPRLMIHIAPAVAKAAMDSGVATRPLDDLEAYRTHLGRYIYRSSLSMRPIFAAAKADPKRIAFCEGEEERVLRAAQTIVDEKIAHPILVGRTHVMEKRIAKLGLRLRLGQDVKVVDPENDPRYPQYWQAYHKLMERKGVSPDYARLVVRTNPSVIGALMVHLGDADGVICGPVGRYRNHLEAVNDIIGLRPGVNQPASVLLMALQNGQYFIADGYANQNPTAQDLADTTIMASQQLQRFGLTPKVALLSHSNFGTLDSQSSLKMREALKIIKELDPDLEVDGEMHADAALDAEIRARAYPDSPLKGQANLLIMPNIEAAHITINTVKCLALGQPVGPILLGMNKSAHIMNASTTPRGLVNIAAVAVVDAQYAANQSSVVKDPLKFPKRKVK